MSCLSSVCAAEGDEGAVGHQSSCHLVWEVSCFSGFPVSHLYCICVSILYSLHMCIHPVLTAYVYPSCTHCICVFILYSLHMCIHPVLTAYVYPSCTHCICVSILYSLHMCIHPVLTAYVYPSCTHCICVSILYSLYMCIPYLYMRRVLGKPGVSTTGPSDSARVSNRLKTT